MYKNLSPGAIGIRGISTQDAIELAQKTGFGGIDVNIQDVAKLVDAQGANYVRDLFAQANMNMGVWGLPVAWQDDDQWQEDLKLLPKLADAAREIGCPRVTTWCPPSSTIREYDENFAWHVERFKAIATVLKDYGCVFGLEFIGPQTLRPSDQFSFIYSMEGMLELIEAIGTGNLGLLLDAWHLYTSGGRLDDLDKITADQIITVHVNDAPEGLTMSEYIDRERRLPMETGVMDLAGFMKKLVKLDYQGAVTPEPFSERVNAIEDPLEAAQLTAAHMDQLWEAGGLG